MHVLDIAENSVAARASLIELCLDIDTAKKSLVITVSDNGGGMDPEMLETVTDPFTTSRTTRRVGMGLPLLKMAAELTGGGLEVESEKGVGTRVRAEFTLGHIDLMPIGDMASTVATLIQCNPKTDFVFTARADELSFTADTRELRAVLGEDVGFDVPEVALWLNGYLEENTSEIIKRSMTL
jgi:hypothetical protein